MYENEGEKNECNFHSYIENGKNVYYYIPKPLCFGSNPSRTNSFLSFL